MDTKAKIAEGVAISAPWPCFSEEEITAVERVLRSGRVNYWTGREGHKFEQEFAAAAGCDFGIAVANGTVALELILRALRVGPGDEVITTGRTFIASASCAVMVGAAPVLVDVDRNSQNLTADNILPAITARTRAIIAVHLNGWPCDMDPILDVAMRHDLPVIEDCAQAHGATYKGSAVGSIGTAGAFSFCQDKIMTTGGEGGLVTTNDAALHQAVWSLKDHGKSYTAATSEAPASRRYETFGTNARMTEMQAAIGRIQLRKLPEWLTARRRNAAMLTACFQNIPGLRITNPPSEINPAWYRYTAFLKPTALKTGWTRDRIVEEIVAAGVPCSAWRNSEIYREGAFARYPQRHMPVARELNETSLIFLAHPTLTEADMCLTCEVVESVMASACTL